jgi:hypothetical protein
MLWEFWISRGKLKSIKLLYFSLNLTNVTDGIRNICFNIEISGEKFFLINDKIKDHHLRGYILFPTTVMSNQIQGYNANIIPSRKRSPLAKTKYFLERSKNIAPAVIFIRQNANFTCVFGISALVLVGQERLSH